MDTTGTDQAPSGLPKVTKDEHDRRVERWTQLKGGSGWTLAVGIGLLFFAGNLSNNLAVGGAVMIVGGAIVYIYSAFQLRTEKDNPWSDEELDEWEEKLLEGELVEPEGGPEVDFGGRESSALPGILPGGQAMPYDNGWNATESDEDSEEDSEEDDESSNQPAAKSDW